jgi:pyocin large subunit-like protein
MGWKLIAAAYRIQVGSSTTKSILIAMCDAGCNKCGLAFPGVPGLEAKTELGGTAVRKALEELIRQGLIRPVRYLNGGRGVSTEYILLQHIVELSTAPCEECSTKMKNPPPRGWYDKGITTKPIATRGVLVKTHHLATENPSRGGDQQSVTDTTVSTEESSPPARLAASSEPTDPTPWAENARRARELANALGVQVGLQSPHTVKDGLPSAETDGHHDKAQGNGHDRETDGEV